MHFEWKPPKPTIWKGQINGSANGGSRYLKDLEELSDIEILNIEIKSAYITSF